MRTTITKVWANRNKVRTLWAKKGTKIVTGVLALAISYGAGHSTGREDMAPEWIGVTVYEDGSVKVEPSEWAQDARSEQWLCWSPESALKTSSRC